MTARILPCLFSCLLLLFTQNAVIATPGSFSFNVYFTLPTGGSWSATAVTNCYTYASAGSGSFTPASIVSWPGAVAVLSSSASGSQPAWYSCSFTASVSITQVGLVISQAGSPQTSNIYLQSPTLPTTQISYYIQGCTATGFSNANCPQPTLNDPRTTTTSAPVTTTAAATTRAPTTAIATTAAPTNSAANNSTLYEVGPFGSVSSAGDQYLFNDALNALIPGSWSIHNITSIGTHSGSWLDSIVVSYGGVAGTVHGGTGGGSLVSVAIPRSNYITHVDIVSGGYVEGIVITLNDASQYSLGNVDPSRLVSATPLLPASTGNISYYFKLIAINGRSNTYVEQLTFIWQLYAYNNFTGVSRISSTPIPLTPIRTAPVRGPLYSVFVLLNICTTPTDVTRSMLDRSLFDDPYALSPFWNTISGGVVSFNRSTSLIVNVTMPCSVFSASVCAYDQWVSYIDNNYASLNLSQWMNYPRRVFIVPQAMGAAGGTCNNIGFQSGQNPSNVYIRSDMLYAVSTGDYLNVFKHECGHSLGLSHSSSWSTDGSWTWQEYGDSSSPMGNGPRSGYVSAHLYALGWASPIVTLSSISMVSGHVYTYTLPALFNNNIQNDNTSMIIIRADWVACASVYQYSFNCPPIDTYIAYRIDHGQDGGLRTFYNNSVNVHRFPNNTLFMAAIAPTKRYVDTSLNLVVSFAGSSYTSKVNGVTVDVACVSVCRYLVRVAECAVNTNDASACTTPHTASQITADPTT